MLDTITVAIAPTLSPSNKSFVAVMPKLDSNCGKSEIIIVTNAPASKMMPPRIKP